MPVNLHSNMPSCVTWQRAYAGQKHAWLNTNLYSFHLLTVVVSEASSEASISEGDPTRLLASVCASCSPSGSADGDLEEPSETAPPLPRPRPRPLPLPLPRPLPRLPLPLPGGLPLLFFSWNAGDHDALGSIAHSRRLAALLQGNRKASSPVEEPQWEDTATDEGCDMQQWHRDTQSQPRWTDRHTGRQTDRQTDMHTGRQTYRQTYT